jgi:hypothetical protein
VRGRFGQLRRHSGSALLEENLTQVELHVPKQLEAPDKRIDHIYFFESGFASVVANGRVRRPMEIALHRTRRHDRARRIMSLHTIFRKHRSDVPEPSDVT